MAHVCNKHGFAPAVTVPIVDRVLLNVARLWGARVRPWAQSDFLRCIFRWRLGG